MSTHNTQGFPNMTLVTRHVYLSIDYELALCYLASLAKMRDTGKLSTEA